MWTNRRSLSGARATEGPGGRRAPGFTLVELMMVLVILGMAASMVVPMIGSTGDLDTRAAARRLTSDMLYAQSYAITNQTRVRVSFNTAASQYTLTSIPAAGSPSVLTHPITRRPYVIGFNATDGLQGVGLGAAVFAGGLSYVEFDSLGAPVPAQGGTVTLVARDGMTKTVRIAAVTGKVSVD